MVRFLIGLVLLMSAFGCSSESPSASQSESEQPKEATKQSNADKKLEWKEFASSSKQRGVRQKDRVMPVDLNEAEAKAWMEMAAAEAKMDDVAKQTSVLKIDSTRTNQAKKAIEKLDCETRSQKPVSPRKSKDPGSVEDITEQFDQYFKKK